MLLVLLVTVSFAWGQEKSSGIKTGGEPEPITKTYELKHVHPRMVQDVVRPYVWKFSYAENSNLITVTLPQARIAEFEAVLKKLDVEKKEVLLRIFTVIASKEGKTQTIDNRDLEKVLTELQKVLSFKSFNVDGVSALSLIDGQRKSILKLSSQQPLQLQLEDVRVQNGVNGKTVKFEFMLKQHIGYSADQSPLYETLIYSETSVNENGYLVAGVSKIGKNGDSLVLVINARIK